METIELDLSALIEIELAEKARNITKCMAHEETGLITFQVKMKEIICTGQFLCYIFGESNQTLFFQIRKGKETQATFTASYCG